MPKKSLREGASASANALDIIIRGPQAYQPQDVQDGQDVQDTRAAQHVKRAQGRPRTQDVPMERLNLKIPAEIKAYLQAAAYRESSPTHTVSLTEYLCSIIKADMEKHSGE